MQYRDTLSGDFDIASLDETTTATAREGGNNRPVRACVIFPFFPASTPRLCPCIQHNRRF